MDLPAFLDVVPSATHLEERLLRALDGAPAALAPATITVEQLIRGLLTALLPEARVAPSTVERLALAGSLRRALATRPQSARQHAGAIEAYRRAIESLHRHGLAADDILRAVDEIPADNAPARARLQLLADVAREVEATLAQRGYVASAAAEACVSAALETLDVRSALPPPLALRRTIVRVTCAQGLDPVRVGFWLALARALGRRGGGLQLHAFSEPRRERTPPALDRALRALEAVEDAPFELQFGLRDVNGPAVDPRLDDVIASLSGGGPPVRSAPIALAEAHGPDEEGRWIAARVEGWLAAGLAPHEIAVVVRDGAPDVVEPLGRALDDARIPWRDACAVPLAASAVARAVLEFPRVVATRADCDAVLQSLAVLGGHAPRPGHAPPHRVAQALRPLGIVSFLDPDLAQRVGDARRRGLATAVADSAIETADALWALLAPADVNTHCGRLTAFVESAGAGQRSVAESHAIMASASFDPGARAIARSMARDEAGLRAVLELLAELPALSAAAGRGATRLSLEEFADLLTDAAAARTLDPSAEGASVVRVSPARSLLGRSLRAVAVAGLNEGGFPAPSADDGLLGEVERSAVLRACGRLLERAGGRDEEALLFLGTIACATEALALCAVRHDVGGRALPPSGFMVDARRVVVGPIAVIHRDPLAQSSALPPRGAERALRAWVRMTVDPPAALVGAAASARGRGAIELERREFFAGRRTEPGRFSGRIDHDTALVRALDLASYGSAKRPVNVTTLERAAGCGYRAFAQDVLHLEAPLERAVTIDRKERGHLLHALVEAGEKALRSTRGRPGVDQLAAVAQALDDAGERFVEREPHAEPALLQADLLAIRRQVERWLNGRMGSSESWEMLETEVAFGPEKKWPALQVPVADQEAIVIHGRIDGVERMGDTVRVVEFKSGRGDGYGKRLREGVLDTQYQLVVYTAALALASHHGALQVPGTIDGLYVGFRDRAEYGLRRALAPGRGRPDADLIDVDSLLREARRGQGAMGTAVRRAIVPLRAGIFPPRPRGCEMCDFGSLCRIESPAGGRDE